MEKKLNGQQLEQGQRNGRVDDLADHDFDPYQLCVFGYF